MPVGLRARDSVPFPALNPSGQGKAGGHYAAGSSLRLPARRKISGPIVNASLTLVNRGLMGQPA
jgi:hypothetical protein